MSRQAAGRRRGRDPCAVTEQVGGETLTEERQALLAQLRDAGFGHTELRGEIPHRALLQEIPDDGVTLALRQRVHRVPHIRLHLARHQYVQRCRRGDGKPVDALRVEVLQAVEGRTRGVGLGAAQLLQRDAQCRRDLRRTGLPAQLRLQRLDGTDASAVLRPHRARCPVPLAQLVQHRSADALGRERRELDAPICVELSSRVDERRGAGPVQVTAVDVRRKPPADLQEHVLDQPDVLPHEPMAFRGQADRGGRAGGRCHRAPPWRTGHIGRAGPAAGGTGAMCLCCR